MQRFILLFAATFLSFACSATAQQISVGPQLSLVGVGASASGQISDLVSISGEFGFIPMGDINLDADDIGYNVNPTVAGGMIGVNVHPLGNNFSVGAGIFFGGYSGDAVTQTLVDEVEIGDQTYDGADVGMLVGEFKWNGISPAITLGLRGKGFNVGIGIAFSGSPDFDVDATGVLRSDPAFQTELQREVDSARDDLDSVPFIPILRIGYQFGVGS